jgi:uncharacterized repeat protein (TIGR03803 family)
MSLKIFRFMRSAALAFLAVGLLLSAAWAQKETVLFNFTGGLNGIAPAAGLIFDAKGNLYGTTEHGGQHDAGVVFKLTPSGVETVSYTFCRQSDCADGAYPLGGVIVDAKGNLYGTASEGGNSNGNYCDGGCGVVFKLTPSGKETALYTFCSTQHCADGAEPYAGLVFDKKGNLYGTTVSGGTACQGGTCGYGTVFKVTPWGEESVLYKFCSLRRCRDGASPIAGLVFDSEGNLYGTTVAGGAHEDGTVFKLTPSGKETALYSFCRQSGCTDGVEPYAGLVLDKKGNLYGTTIAGGGGLCAEGCGVVFKVTPSGKETTLYSFAGYPDGGESVAGLVLDQEGNLYGTTYYDGAYKWGSVFRVTPSGKETLSYSFHGYPDGLTPAAGLVFDKKGNLYGTTSAGGDHDYGTVFKLKP